MSWASFLVRPDFVVSGFIWGGHELQSSSMTQMMNLGRDSLMAFGEKQPHPQKRKCELKMFLKLAHKKNLELPKQKSANVQQTCKSVPPRRWSQPTACQSSFLSSCAIKTSRHKNSWVTTLVKPVITNADIKVLLKKFKLAGLLLLTVMIFFHLQHQIQQLRELSFSKKSFTKAKHRQWRGEILGQLMTNQNILFGAISFLVAKICCTVGICRDLFLGVLGTGVQKISCVGPAKDFVIFSWQGVWESIKHGNTYNIA